MKASARTLLRVELHGVDLPGRSCGPRPGGGWYEDIQVGLKRGTTAIDLSPRSIPHSSTRRCRLGARSWGASCSPTKTAGRAVPVSIHQRLRGRSETLTGQLTRQNLGPERLAGLDHQRHSPLHHEAIARH